MVRRDGGTAMTTSLRTMVDYIGYMYRRNNWIIDFRRLKDYSNSIKIDRPIFLVGNQGGGLTLVSRMLRRHQQVVSITGDSSYWAGADEMQKVMMTRLPKRLRLGGRVFAKDYPHPVFTPPRSWSYGSDDLIDRYVCSETDASERDSTALRRIMSEAIAIHGSQTEPRRFVDKSQVYALKMRYVQALLADCNPMFVLVTRNPYVACYRAAIGKAGDMFRYKDQLSYEERLNVCAEHWSNVMDRVLQDSKSINNFAVFRFEDFLTDTEESVKDLCEFTGLEYQQELVPQANDTIPFASRRIDRWYPLRPDVNTPYLKKLDSKSIEIVSNRCEALAEQFGYSKPQPALENSLNEVA